MGTNEESAERKKRDTSGKHHVIIEHAIAVFSRKGFDAASMDEIAEAAGVSKKTVYNHFQSKERLFQEIVADFLKQRDSRKPIKYSPEVPLELQLREFAMAEVFLVDDPLRRALSKLLTSVFLLKTEFGNATRGNFEPYKDLISWLIEARADGKLRFQAPELAARMFYGLVEGCITWAAILTDGASLRFSEPQLDELIAVFLSRYGEEAPRAPFPDKK